jgi:hypothetical protein
MYINIAGIKIEKIYSHFLLFVAVVNIELQYLFRSKLLTYNTAVVTESSFLL